MLATLSKALSDHRRGMCATQDIGCPARVPSGNQWMHWPTSIFRVIVVFACSLPNSEVSKLQFNKMDELGLDVIEVLKGNQVLQVRVCYCSSILITKSAREVHYRLDGLSHLKVN